MNTDIICLCQYDRTAKFYINAYNNGYTKLCYLSSSDDSKIVSVDLKATEITLEDLEIATYAFWCEDDNSNKTNVLNLEITGETLEERFSGLLENRYASFLNVADTEKPDTIWTDLLNAYLSDQDNDDIITILNLLIKNYNGFQNYYNDKKSRVSIDKKNIIIIDCSSIDFGGSNVVLEFATLNHNSNEWETQTVMRIYDFPYKILLSENNIYRISVIKNDSMIKRLIIFAEKGYSDKNYEEILKQKERYSQAAESSSYFLPNSYEYTSGREEEIILNLNMFDRSKTILPKPKLSFEEPIITYTPDEHAALFEFGTYYLCGISEEDIYYEDAVPVRIKIGQEAMDIDYGQKMFENKPYYFYFANEDLQRISRVTYIDLRCEESPDTTDYNSIYQNICQQRYIKRLHDIFEFFMPNAWEEIKPLVDEYLNEEETAFLELEDYLITKICKNVSRITYSIPLMIYYIELAQQKYYLPKKTDFIQSHTYNRLTRMHIIAKAEYITKITYIDFDGNIFYFYVDGRKESVFFRTDAARYLIFRDIDIAALNVSDFGYYYTPEKDKINHRFNSLEVEIK